MERPTGIRWLIRLLSCIRFDDVLVLQGTPVLGAIFALGRLSEENLTAMLLLIAGNICLVAHVFLLNDWAGISQDIKDPARPVFLERGIRRGEIGALLLILLNSSLAIFARLGLATLAIGGLIAIASALYSIPRVHAKGIPLANSLLHIVGGVLHFLLGYSVFQAVDANGVQTALFFALIFSAGHLTQEVRDFEVDARNGIQTNAVYFGRKACFVAAFGLFTAADLLLLALAVKGAVPSAMAVIILLAWAVQSRWTLRTLHAGLSPASVRNLQVRYRLLYALIGLIMVALLHHQAS